MIGGGDSLPDTAHVIAVALRLADPALHGEIAGFLAGAAGLVMVARSDDADVVVTDMLPEADEPAVVIGNFELIATAFGRGSAGLLRHQIDGERLRIAVEAAHRGLVCAPRSTAVRSIDNRSRFDAEHGSRKEMALSNRERQVLKLMAGGASNKAIARLLGISVHTAKFHVASVIGKLGATGRTEAVAIAIRQGLVHL